MQICAPRGKALEKIIIVITKLITGSQKYLYFQVICQMIRPVAMTPTLPKASPRTCSTRALMFIEPWECPCLAWVSRRRGVSSFMKTGESVVIGIGDVASVVIVGDTRESMEWRGRCPRLSRQGGDGDRAVMSCAVLYEGCACCHGVAV